MKREYESKIRRIGLDIENKKKNAKKWYFKNRDKSITKALIWNKNNPEKRHKTHVKRTYGVSSDKYDEMYNKQNGICAICSKSETSKLGDTIRHLCVDHSHETGEIRGLL